VVYFVGAKFSLCPLWAKCAGKGFAVVNANIKDCVMGMLPELAVRAVLRELLTVEACAG
jgi:hypothetical protein